MPRLYSEAPVNSIWEGSGNVMCLDVLRAIERDAEGFELLLQSFRDADIALADFRAMPAEQREAGARRFTQQLVLAAQCSLMRRHAPAASADAFIAGCRDAQHGRVFGSLPNGTTFADILQRAWPDSKD
jgi:putative acyl-CoA dehydrogenase